MKTQLDQLLEGMDDGQDTQYHEFLIQNFNQFVNDLDKGSYQAKLFDLILKADDYNLHRLALVYPKEVKLVQLYRYGKPSDLINGLSGLRSVLLDGTVQFIDAEGKQRKGKILDLQFNNDPKVVKVMGNIVEELKVQAEDGSKHLSDWSSVSLI